MKWRVVVPAMAALLAPGCGRPTTPAAERPRDDAAAQVANERAAEDKVVTQATLARLSREVDDLHNEIDQIKAGKQAMNEELIGRRLQALEVRAASEPAIVPAAVPPPAPTSAPVALTATRPKPKADPARTEPKRHAVPAATRPKVGTVPNANAPVRD